jgi:hypothetical protein
LRGHAEIIELSESAAWALLAGWEQADEQAHMTQQLTALDALAAGDYHDRRRSEPRVLCERPIWIQPCARADAARFCRAQLTDCSLHGLGLMLSQPIEAGQQILVKLTLGGRPTMLVYTIRYCIPMQVDQYRAGARFAGLAAEKFQGELSGVVAALAGSSAA